MYRSCARLENHIKQNHKCIVLFRTTFRTLVAFLFCDRHSCTSTKGTKSVLEKRRFSGFLSTSPAIHGNYTRKLLMNRPFLTECNTENFHVTFLFSYVALQLFYRVLAFSTNSFHLLLSWARVFQFGTFDFCISFLTSSTQHVFGLPIGLLETGFQEYIAFTILVPCILSM